MNILVYLEGVTIGGQQTIFYNLLKNVDAKKHKTFVAFMTDGALRPSFESVAQEVVQLRETPNNWITATKNPFHVLKTAWKVRRLVRKLDIDVVVTSGMYTYITGAIGGKLAGAKVAQLLGHEPSKDKFYWKYFHFLQLHRITDLYFGFSYGNKELLSKGVNAKKLIDIGNTVDTKFFKPTFSDAEIKTRRHDLGIKDDELAIGWVGRIFEGMEVRFTIEMAKHLLDKNFSKFKLLIIGDGPWMAEFKQQIDHLGLTPHCLFMGWQMPENVRDLIELMDVMPLLDHDPIGGCIVREAMSMSRTVLSVDGQSGFQAEWVSNGVNGILVPPDDFTKSAADVCIDLYNRPEYRKQLGEAGRTYAINNMDYSIKAKIFQECCEKLISLKPSQLPSQ